MAEKRVVAHLAGGLGNQLFIFAAAWATAHRCGAKLYLDLSAFARDWEYKRSFAIHHFQGVAPIPVRSFPLANVAQRVLQKMQARMSGLPVHIGSLFGERHYLELDQALLGNPFRGRSTVHVFGFRQNEAYFADLAGELRAMLQLALEPSPQLRAQGAAIRARNSVSVNLRRLHEVIPGTNLPKAGLRILGREYYHHAVRLIQERVTDPVFYCFGDTLEGIDELLLSDARRVVLPDTPDRPADIRDFWLMMQCRHFVIANSTFSWWAAWLGQQCGSVVVCPDTEGFQYQIAPAAGWLVT